MHLVLEDLTEEGWEIEPCVLHELLDLLAAVTQALQWEGREREARAVAAAAATLAKEMAPLVELGYPECGEARSDLRQLWGLVHRELSHVAPQH